MQYQAPFARKRQILQQSLIVLAEHMLSRLVCAGVGSLTKGAHDCAQCCHQARSGRSPVGPGEARSVSPAGRSPVRRVCIYTTRHRAQGTENICSIQSLFCQRTLLPTLQCKQPPLGHRAHTQVDMGHQVALH